MGWSSIAVAASAEDDEARVRLNVTSDEEPGVSAQVLQVQRAVDGGWVDVRGTGDVQVSGPWQATVYDYEAPSFGTVEYRARAVDASDTAQQGPWSSTEQVATEVEGFWLIDVQVPSLGGRVHLDRVALEWERDRTQGTFNPLGRNRPVVVSGPRRGRRYQAQLLLIGNSIFDRYEKVTESGRPLLLRTDTGDMLYVVEIAPAAVSVAPTASRAERPVHRVSTTLLEVDRPEDLTAVT